jgi:hypothetical protein
MGVDDSRSESGLRIIDEGTELAAKHDFIYRGVDVKGTFIIQMTLDDELRCANQDRIREFVEADRAVEQKNSRRALGRSGNQRMSHPYPKSPRTPFLDH